MKPVSIECTVEIPQTRINFLHLCTKITKLGWSIIGIVHQPASGIGSKELQYSDSPVVRVSKYLRNLYAAGLICTVT